MGRGGGGWRTSGLPTSGQRCRGALQGVRGSPRQLVLAGQLGRAPGGKQGGWSPVGKGAGPGTDGLCRRTGKKLGCSSPPGELGPMDRGVGRGRVCAQEDRWIEGGMGGRQRSAEGMDECRGMTEGCKGGRTDTHVTQKRGRSRVSRALRRHFYLGGQPLPLPSPIPPHSGSPGPTSIPAPPPPSSRHCRRDLNPDPSRCVIQPKPRSWDALLQSRH